MRPLALEIHEFRGWHDSGRIPVDRPITLVVGANGRGKSSTLAAVEWCLFGREVESAGGLGLPERADWEIRPRDAGAGPTEVRLTFAVEGGEAALTRRRARGAAARTPDEVEVALPGGIRLEGAEALQWARRELPDLETFRRAHVLHADAIRRRATDKADRSAVLAALLGLDEDRTSSERLAALRPTDLVKEVDQRLRRLEADLQAAAERPRRERDEVERRLEARGLARADLGPRRAESVRRRLLDRARALALRLGLPAPFPDPSDAEAVRAWAQAWPATARGPAPALAVLPVRRHGQAVLATAVAALEPLETALSTARRACEEAVRTGGDRPAREKSKADAEARARAAAADLKRASALVSLLREALPFVPDVDERTACPVCATPVKGLRERIEADLARHERQETARLEEARAKAKVALDAAERALEDLERLEKAGKSARTARDDGRKALVSLLPAPLLPPEASAEGFDVAAAARARLETLQRDLDALEGLSRERDQSLSDHATDVEVLRDLEAWEAAVARLDRDVEATRCPSWDRLDRALDEAGGFAADVEALAATARDVQAARSGSREAEVNRALSDYYDLIVGEGGRGLRVGVHQTPKGLDYRLADRDGLPAVPVLNQAAINAVSLALLFAQAEERAREGGLAWVLLDDPAQSLDTARQQGLSRAVERLSASCAVLGACTDSEFVDRVRGFVARPRRVLALGPRDPARGAWFESEDAP